ncbi:MAG: alpha/beta hydrolase [Candidatus Moranbacteria bacterium]|nr:alpha/beta hydrolase [Candidatus Moranbacteria bacterium]
MFESRKYRRVFFSGIFVIAAAGVFSWQGVSLVFSDESDTVEISESVVWEGAHVISGNIIINPDVTVTVTKGANLVFEGGSRLSVQGTLTVNGTVKEPVLLKKQHPDILEETYTVSVERGGVANLRNVDVSGGGSLTSVFQVERNPSLLPTAYALDVYSGAIDIMNGGHFFADGVSFHHNVVAILIRGGRWSLDDVRVQRSKFFENSQFDVVNMARDTAYDFRYNWWDHVTSKTEHEHIMGLLDTSFLAPEKDFHDPVIVVPGMLGSYPILRAHETEPVWALDPLFQNYRDLVASLRKNGLDEDVYEFPYDWRESNVLSAKLLAQKIQEIKEARHWPKVDIVAHSMGGLVAREYIESNEYQADVDQLITLGTPELGAPEAYLRWDGAKWFWSFSELMQEFVFKQWAKHEGFDDIYDYLHEKPIISVRELLPTYDYLARLKDGEYLLSPYGDGYPHNEFLENLNTSERVAKLSGVEFTKIIGKLMNDESTIAGFRVIDADKGKYWKHGYPDDIESLNPSNAARGIIGSDGDGTVPLVSALASEIPSDYTLTLEGVTHDDLPTEGQDEVLETLGIRQPYEEVRMSKVKKMLAFFLFSPIDVQVISPSGKRVGKNFENGEIYDEIPGTFYTGYHTENEFVTIPNPEKGEYRVLTQGTGTGKYRIEIAHIVDSKDLGNPATESVVTLSGTTEMDTLTEAPIMVTDNAVTVPSEPTDALPPVTHISLSGTQGQHNWYTSAVTVTLSAQDETSGSGVEQTQYSLDNGISWTAYSQPFILTNEGVFALQYRSIDRAGNQEVAQTEVVQIDQTSPEAYIVLNTETQKLDIVGRDSIDQHMLPADIVTNDIHLTLTFWQQRLMKFRGISFPSTKTIVTATLVDAAGHTTILTFDQSRNQKNRLFLTLQSLVSDGVTTKPMTTLQYKWQKDKNQQYTRLASALRTQRDFVEMHYLPVKNRTRLMRFSRDLADDESDDDSDYRLARKNLPGMVIPGILTERGNTKIIY